MHVELMTVCKIIQEGNLRDAIEFGLTPDDFTNDEAQAIYRKLLAIYQSSESSGSVLGPTLAAKEFPHLPWNQVDEHVTTEHLFHEVRKGRLTAYLQNTILKASDYLGANDLRSAIEQMQSALSTVQKIEVGRNHDTPGAKGLRSAIEMYDKRKSGEDSGVAHWAWPELTTVAGPILDDDYIIWYGRPKNMKTWLLLYQAAHTVFEQQVPAVIYTKEMTKENLFQRLASIVARVPYGPTRLGMLSPPYEAKFREGMQYCIEFLEQREKDNLLWVLSGKEMAGKDTISWFRSKVERYKPKISFIDGLYLMSPENSKLVKTNERLENVSRACRQMILDLKVPVVCTLQANRQAAKHDKGEMDEIAMSDAFSQDCTAALRTIKDKGKHASGKQTVSVVVAGSREWNLEGMRVYGEPSTDFGFCEYLSEDEASKVSEKDNEAAAKATGAKEAKATERKKPEKGRDPDRIAAIVQRLASR